ncbi:class I SAM-dependent methyltransferase [Salegentibacter sp. LM13S]|uniref:class I SAM-dependent methyltransferase n=1 Tax=Salegentibacter lacus TaxID=2873599 RepID=UPI001CCA2A90|nr:class I SAM-dependent methyltransferase [Salegentibacter lacus]MBZ9631258.1 class I SAM-dependent methyltransferase [Salegentibacter lacus]
MAKTNKIEDQNAVVYIKNVNNHKIYEDIEWLMEVGRFPVSSNILDIGCGTGSLLKQLGKETEYNRYLKGIEGSVKMHNCASENLKHIENAEIILSDFEKLDKDLLLSWTPDIMIMSFFLHHCNNIDLVFNKASEILKKGGKLYLFDRFAISDNFKSDFESYWNNCYERKHEWKEEMPNIQSLKDIEFYSQKHGFVVINYKINPHDGKIGCNLFPKSFIELWKVEATIFSCLIISPAFDPKKEEILNKLIAETSINDFSLLKIPYTRSVLEQIYPDVPWAEEFFKFAETYSPNSEATVVVPKNSNSVQILSELTQFKKLYRGDWKDIVGDVHSESSNPPLILPFHVPEPWETYQIKKLIEEYNGPI